MTEYLPKGKRNMNFDHIINWKLKKGSHDFPGPEGGTCINEAAIVAAGFEYRSVSSASDCPPCFSRPIAQYAISLNDAMPDDVRQKLLMPFVVRLSGTADKPEVEMARVEFMVIETVRRILPLLDYPEHIKEKCRQVTDIPAARAAARAAAAAARAAAAADGADIWTIATEILDGAIRLGNQPSEMDATLVCERMEQAKALEAV